MTEPFEFDGPMTAYCFGRTYDTLTSVGVKRGGNPYPGDGAHTEVEAWAKFEGALAEYKHGAAQIAWRTRPVVYEIDGKFYITSRLAVYP